MILVITPSPLKTQLYKIVVESFAFMQAFHENMICLVLLLDGR